MPLKKGKSKKIISSNIKELMTGEMGSARRKGMESMMKERGMSMEEAKHKQSIAIAYSKAGKSKKKGKMRNFLHTLSKKK